MKIALLLPLSLAGFSPAAFAQAVLSVDAAGGSGSFQTIQAAVDAAADGDVVVVRPGTYTDFALAGKGISVVADDDGGVGVVEIVGVSGDSTTFVTGVPAGERALLRGLRFRAPVPQIFGAVLSLSGNPGVVVLEDLDIDATSPLPAFFQVAQNEALDVADCAHVLVINSTVVGATGGTSGGQEFGARGMTAAGSQVFVHGCEFRPGGTTVGGGTGREAVQFTDGTLVLRDSTLVGGPGGFGCSGLCPVGQFPPGNGGPSLVAGDGANVFAINTQLMGGLRGQDLLSGVPGGNPGPSFMTVGTGTVVEQVAHTTSLATTPLVRDDDPLQAAVELNLTSDPDSIVAMFLDFETTPAFVPGLPGFIVFGLESVVLSGTTDALGGYELSIEIPSFPPELQKLDLTVQGVVLTAADGLEVSNPSIFTLING